MSDPLDFYVNRLAGNRLPGLLRELADAIRSEDDPEQLRRLWTSLNGMGSIVRNRLHTLTQEPTK